MARQTFFSFHYKEDSWRAGQVRNSWVTQDRRAAGFFDSAEWEQVKKQSDDAIKAWIDKQLIGTTVTVVLIGTNTASRKWIKYEIESSIRRGNGLLGIYIHNIKNQDQKTSLQGANPLPSGVPTYDWVTENGYANMGKWIETAAIKAGK